MLTASDFNWNIEQSEVTKVFVQDTDEPWSFEMDPFNSGSGAIYTNGECPVVAPLTY